MTTSSRLILALDQGTTSSRALLVGQDGSIITSAQQEFTQHFPQPGWVEHDPRDIWASQAAVIREAVKKAGVSHDHIAGIGITNQRETTLLWDRTSGEPVHNAIVWQDRRTADTCNALKDQGYEDYIRERTGLPIDAYFSGTKLKWMLDHVEGARDRARKGELAFGTVDSWLIWNLTGGKVHATDVTNASRTMLFNIHTLDWDDDILRLLDIPRSLLPDVVSCSEIIGETTPDLLGGPVPIAGVAGDQHAALFGQMGHEPGKVKQTYGTGGFMMLNTGSKPKRSEHKLVTTIAWKIGSKTTYALEASIFIAGAVVQWLRDGLGLIETSEASEALAESVPDNGGVYFVPAFTGLGAPHWDPDARGTIIGLSRGTTAGHIARAALESIAWQTGDVFAAMVEDSGFEINELRVDGGASENNLLMQFQADILGVPLIRPRITETTAMGAAYLAGLATGVWADVDEIAAQWQVDRRFTPALGEDEVNTKREHWLKAVERAKHWA